MDPGELVYVSEQLAMHETDWLFAVRSICENYKVSASFFLDDHQ